MFLPESLVQKLDRRFLFELETLAHRLAGVYQQSHLQGKIRLTIEAEDRLGRLVVVQNLEILVLEVLHVVAVLVGDGENQVNLAYRLAQREERFLGFCQPSRIWTFWSHRLRLVRLGRDRVLRPRREQAQ